MFKTLLLTLSTVITLCTLPAFSQTPDFTSNIVEGCAPLVVKFTDKSTGNPILSWEWDMGNGLPIYEKNPTTTFLNPGNYTVKLTINKGNGEKSVTKTSYIKVYANPIAAFTSTPPQGCFPLPVTFTDQSTPESGSLVKWEWDFGDGSPFSSDKNPQHVYDYIGGYHVVLRVTNSHGCEKTLSKLNYVKISTGAKADFNLTAPNNCNPPTNVNFTDNSESVGPLTYAWNFGDGNTSDQPNPVHSYTKAGTYSVSLNITNDVGCQNKIIKTNVITIGAVKADFTAPAKICAGQQLNIVNTSTPAPNAARWDFGNGDYQYSVVPYYAYPTPGTYTIKLESNFGACTGITTKTIEVLGKPTVNFSADKTTGCATPTTINFTTNTSETLTYKWDFGDGTTSTEKNPKHVYNKLGDFTVTLVATNSIGCAETVSFYNYIRVRKPQIAFSGQIPKGCAPLSVSPQYYWLEYGEPVTEYIWVWGDGDTTKGESNPTHIYTTPGYHNYKLIYKTASGCTVTVPGAGVSVGVKPDINFTATPPITCAFKGITFKDITTGVQPDEWLWEFGDGGWSSDKNPVHYYSDTGTFNVRLIAKNSGCADTLVIEKIVTIRGPIALFTDSFSCGNKQKRYFRDRSIEAISWSWNFGDGSTSTEQNPEHTYARAGIYNVSLTVKNDTCQHTNSRQIIVSQSITDFTTSKTNICTGEEITFNAPNLNTNGSYYYYYYWDFGDGNTGGGYYYDNGTAKHIYNLPGTYDVKLFWYDGNGCSDSVVKKQHIKANGPRAGFIVPTGIICANTPVVFQDTSTGNPSALKSWTWNYGDGTVETKTSAPFTHTYTQQGYYYVSLTVTDQSGCKSNAIQYSMFNILKPTSQFESTDLVSCTEKPIRFVNYSFGADNDYQWSFGDGKTSTDYQPTTQYSQDGLYEIKLITKDMFGCTDTMTRSSYIKIADPKALFTVSDSIASCPPLVIDFRNKSKNFNSYQWDFGDNTRPAPNENPSHFYALPGTYYAKLKITSPGGCIDEMSQKLIVKGPTGDFSYDVTGGCRPLTVKFSGRTTSTASFIWDYNDGKVEPGGPEITYTYTSMGQYLPRMILVDPDGCRVPFPGPDTISVLGAESLFKANADVVCDSGFVQFTNMSYANERITNYKWTFEPGHTSAETDPAHYYKNLGRYPAELITTTVSGCKDTLLSDFDIKVAERPIVGFRGDTSVCMPVTLRFAGEIIRNDSSTLSWAWNFGNGATARSQFPVSALYREQRDHTAELIVTTTLGCKDTVHQLVHALPIPQINAGEDKTIPVGSDTKIIATHSPDVTAIVWTPVTALSCTTCADPVAAPKKTTEYSVEVLNNSGCRNKDEMTVFVFCNNGNLFMPNTFSPNNDGSNDVYYPRGKGLFMVKAFKIFNRWGEIIFQKYDFAANDVTKGWNGSYNNKPASQDVYVYSVDIVCENGTVLNYRGNIALIR